MEIAHNKQSVLHNENEIQVHILYFKDKMRKKSQIDLTQIKDLKRFHNSELYNNIDACFTDRSFMAFVPNSPKYDVDFVLVDSREEPKKVIYLIQTAINIISHKRNDKLFSEEIQNLSNVVDPIILDGLVGESSSISYVSQSNALFNCSKGFVQSKEASS